MVKTWREEGFLNGLRRGGDRPVLLTRKSILASCLAVSLCLALVFISLGGLFVWVNHNQNVRAKQDRRRDIAFQQSNRERIEVIERVQRLEDPPTQRELAAAALTALRACGRDDRCRRQFRRVVRRSRLTERDLPALRPLTPAVRRNPRPAGPPPQASQRRPGGGTVRPRPPAQTGPAPPAPSPPPTTTQAPPPTPPPAQTNPGGQTLPPQVPTVTTPRPPEIPRLPKAPPIPGAPSAPVDPKPPGQEAGRAKCNENAASRSPCEDRGRGGR